MTADKDIECITMLLTFLLQQVTNELERLDLSKEYDAEFVTARP